MGFEMPSSFEQEKNGVEEEREVSPEEYQKMTLEERKARWPIKRDNDSEKRAA